MTKFDLLGDGSDSSDDAMDSADEGGVGFFSAKRAGDQTQTDGLELDGGTSRGADRGKGRGRGKPTPVAKHIVKVPQGSPKPKPKAKPKSGGGSLVDKCKANHEKIVAWMTDFTDASAESAVKDNEVPALVKRV